MGVLVPCMAGRHHQYVSMWMRWNTGLSPRNVLYKLSPFLHKQARYMCHILTVTEARTHSNVSLLTFVKRWGRLSSKAALILYPNLQFSIRQDGGHKNPTHVLLKRLNEVKKRLQLSGSEIMDQSPKNHMTADHPGLPISLFINWPQPLPTSTQVELFKQIPNVHVMAVGYLQPLRVKQADLGLE